MRIIALIMSKYIYILEKEAQFLYDSSKTKLYQSYLRSTKLIKAFRLKIEAVYVMILFAIYLRNLCEMCMMINYLARNLR